MRIATPQQVIAAMGIQENSGSLAAAGAALDVTSRIIEKLLETQLEQATYTDYFDYNYSRMRARFEPPRFYLSNRFVDTSEAVTAKESSTAMRLHTEGTEVAATDYVLDAGQGTVEVLRDLPIGYYTFSVTYTAGFVTSGPDKVLRDIPGWLLEAGRVAAIHYLNMTPAHIASKKVATIKEITKAIDDRVSALINSEKRERMGMHFPGRCVRHD